MKELKNVLNQLDEEETEGEREESRSILPRWNGENGRTIDENGERRENWRALHKHHDWSDRSL